MEMVPTGTIPGAVNIPHDEVVERMAELDSVDRTVVFCNGPQCTATSQAIDALLAAGWPAERLLYYRSFGGSRLVHNCTGVRLTGRPEDARVLKHKRTVV
jgi:hypothetical protein